MILYDKCSRNLAHGTIIIILIYQGYYGLPWSKRIGRSFDLMVSNITVLRVSAFTRSYRKTAPGFLTSAGPSVANCGRRNLVVVADAGAGAAGVAAASVA